MTLIVFKDNVLAGDSRSTRSIPPEVGGEPYTCGHCSKPASVVRDATDKLVLMRSKHKPSFRGDKILAFAAAGETSIIANMRSIIRYGKNIEEVYENYRSILGTFEENKTTCTMLLVCENKNYTIRIPKKGKLIVKEYEKKDFIAIGSGQVAAQWINRLIPNITAPLIINMVMVEGVEVGVGGDIRTIDFNTSEPSILPATKYDPQFLVDMANKAFSQGEEVITNSLD